VHVFAIEQIEGENRFTSFQCFEAGVSGLESDLIFSCSLLIISSAVMM